MIPKCHACPIAGECGSYEYLCGKMAEAPDRYRAILDSVNGEPADEPSPEDLALQAYMARHGCGSC